MMQRATVLFGHGSRDPLWRVPIESVAARMREVDPQCQVRCAYLELMEPDLPGAVQQLVAGGASAIRIVPMFLGVGRHARQDLPVLMADLAQAHPDIRFELLPAVGEDRRVLELLARLALD